MRGRATIRRLYDSFSTGAGATADVVLPRVGQPGGVARLVQVYLTPGTVAAGAASWQAGVGGAVITAFTDEPVRYVSAATAVTVGASHTNAERITKAVEDPSAPDVLVPLDSDGAAHLRIEFDAGVGHTGTYEVAFEVVNGA